MESEKPVREIQAVLEAIERDVALYEETNFGGRLQALDAIEVSVLDPLEDLLAANGQAGALVALKQRAEMARSRLEATDEGLFRRLRAGIRSGALRGAELKRRLEACAGCGRGKRCQNGGAYDSLDALIGDILLSGAAPGETAGRESEMVFYQPTPGRIIFELVERANFQKDDTLYDLGSGLGHVVILAHLLSGVTAKGVEVDPGYCEYATRCARELNLSGVEFFHTDAREADYAGGTAFFLYTPFEGKMLQDVLDRLRGEAQERRIDVYTYGPCTVDVSRQNWLEPVGPDAGGMHSLVAFRSLKGER